MRYLRAGAALALLGVTGVLGPTSPSGADDTHPYVTDIKSTPDNDVPQGECAPWARDTLKRTTIVQVEEETVRVSFHDVGVFDLSDGRQGTLVGDLEYTELTGTLRSADELPPDPDALDNSEFPCKGEVPSELTTCQWPRRFVDVADYPSCPIGPWEWTYTLCGVAYVENGETEPVGPDKFPDADSEECAPPETTTTTTISAEPDLPTDCAEAALRPEQYWPHLDGDRDGVSCEEDAPPAVPQPRQPTFTG